MQQEDLLPDAKVTFDHNMVSAVTNYLGAGATANFRLRVLCKHFDWQTGSVAQIFGALRPLLSAVECLMTKRGMLAERQIPQRRAGRGTSFSERLLGRRGLVSTTVSCWNCRCRCAMRG